MDGAQGNSYANLSYGTYHSILQTAIDTVEAHFQAGKLLNLVEHNQSDQRVELGYLLSVSDLDLSNLQLIVTVDSQVYLNLQVFQVLLFLR